MQEKIRRTLQHFRITTFRKYCDSYLSTYFGRKFKKTIIDNGYSINEAEYNDLLDCAVDEAAARNPELLSFIINRSLSREVTSKGIMNLFYKNDYILGLNFDRQWAYSIWDRYMRGELKVNLKY